MNVIEILQKQYETEYRYTKVSVLHPEAAGIDAHTCCWYAVQRCLGMAQLAQSMGATFHEVEPLFEEIKKRLMELENNA